MQKTSTFLSALAILEAHGLIPGPDGFDLHELTALATQCCWHVFTERTTYHTPNRRWRATVSQRSTFAGTVGGIHRGAHGAGATEADALAIALASMIRQHGA